MNDAASGIEQLELMLFRVNGVLFCSELRQVGGVFAPEEDVSPAASRLDDFFFGKPPNSQGNWKLIKLKAKQVGGSEWGFMAEEPEDIVNVSIDDLRPLPVIIEKLKHFKSLWGSFFYKDEIGLLLDLPGLYLEMQVGKNVF